MDGVEITRLELKQRQLAEQVRRNELNASDLNRELKFEDQRYQLRQQEFRQVRERLLQEPGREAQPQARLERAVSLRERLQTTQVSVQLQRMRVEELAEQRAQAVAALAREKAKLEKVQSGIANQRQAAAELRDELNGQTAVETMLVGKLQGLALQTVAGLNPATAAELTKSRELSRMNRQAESADDNQATEEKIADSNIATDSQFTSNSAAIIATADALSSNLALSSDILSSAGSHSQTGSDSNPNGSAPQGSRDQGNDAWQGARDQNGSNSSKNGSVYDLESWNGAVGCGVQLTYVSSSGREVSMRLEEAGPDAVTVRLSAQNQHDSQALQRERSEVLELLKKRGISVRRFEITGFEKEVMV